MRDDSVRPIAPPKTLPLATVCALIALSTSLATPGWAGDGRIEINQVRALAGGVTPGDLPGFPVTIDTPGSYVLTGDLNVADPSSSGIEVLADGVAIDLAGHALQGGRTCTGEGASVVCDVSTPGATGIDLVSAGHGLSVRDGIVRGFHHGIDTRFGFACRIEHLLLARNSGSGLIDALGCVVVETTSERNAGAGFSLQHGILTRSVAVGNAQAGASVQMSVVSAITARSNGGSGMDVFWCNVIADNTASANGGNGISAYNGLSSILFGNASTLNAFAQIAFPVVPTVGWMRNVLRSDPDTPGSTTVTVGGAQLGPNVCDGAICP